MRKLLATLFLSMTCCATECSTAAREPTELIDDVCEDSLVIGWKKDGFNATTNGVVYPGESQYVVTSSALLDSSEEVTIVTGDPPRTYARLELVEEMDDYGIAVFRTRNILLQNDYEFNSSLRYDYVKIKEGPPVHIASPRSLFNTIKYPMFACLVQYNGGRKEIGGLLSITRPLQFDYDDESEVFGVIADDVMSSEEPDWRHGLGSPVVSLNDPSYLLGMVYQAKLVEDNYPHWRLGVVFFSGITHSRIREIIDFDKKSISNNN